MVALDPDSIPRLIRVLIDWAKDLESGTDNSGGFGTGPQPRRGQLSCLALSMLVWFGLLGVPPIAILRFSSRWKVRITPGLEVRQTPMSKSDRQLGMSRDITRRTSSMVRDLRQ